MMSAPTDSRIKVERPAPEVLMRLGVGRWPIWTKEVSTFEWEYDQQEICYFLDGEVTVKTEVSSVKLKTGDLVTFSQGLACIWEVTKPVRKHFKFG